MWGGVKLPDSVTFSGTGSASINPYKKDSGNNPSASIGASASIPTMGYHYANITAASSSVGVGNNIDISNVSSIDVSASSGFNWLTHWQGNDSYFFGSGTASYTVTLHN